MTPTIDQKRDETFAESLQNHSLSELEDIYAHLDRDSANVSSRF